MRRGIVLASILSSLSSMTAHAAPDTEMDAIMQGFDDAVVAPSPVISDIPSIMDGFEDSSVSTTPTDTAITKPKPRSSLDFNGTLRLSESLNYQHAAPAPGDADFRGLSRARIKFVPEVRWKIKHSWQAKINGSLYYDAAYQLNGREQFTTETLDTHEREAQIREAYVIGSVTPNLDIKLGRQVVAWGKSDGVRVVDVLNPLDMREIGMIDIEDLRLPVTMGVANLYLDNWKLSAIVIPEISFNKMPGYGSEFYPSDKKPGHENIPDSNLQNMEYAMALNGQFHGWDLSFHAARYYDDNFHVTSITNGAATLAHSDLNMLGVAGNVVTGSSLFKAEAAFINGLNYFQSGNTDYRRIDAMLGIDYNGITNTTLTLELLDQFVLNYDSKLASSPDEVNEHETTVSMRYTQTFLREKLKAMVLAGLFGKLFEDGAFYRAQVSYDIVDALKVTGGVLAFQGADKGLFNAIARNDRVFGELSYSF